MATDERPLILNMPEFGRIDAESETQLADFFIRTLAYRRIIDVERFIVLGRKGTGKTAIYRALLQRAARFRTTHAIGLDFRAYPWQDHARAADPRAAHAEQYTESWQFLILLELAKLALLSPRAIPDTPQARSAYEGVTRFLRANWGQVQFDFKDTFVRPRYSLSPDLDLPTPFRGADAHDSAQLPPFLIEANRWLKTCLNSLLTPEYTYFVLFDDLDRGYALMDRSYSDRLIGLQLAAREIYLWASTLGLSVGPIVFLRSDIYDDLRFPDKNKMTHNYVEHLTWTDDFEGENSLKALMDQRIRAMAELPTRLLDPWPLVFDDKLMRGTQHKFKHMAARTYLRPRDMIQFGNLCLQQARAAGSVRIQNRDIAAARPSYSIYLVDELDDEMAEAVPVWPQLMDVLRRIHHVRFSPDDFRRAYVALCVADGYGMGADEALEALFRFSVLGFTKTGGAGYGGSAVAFRYRDPRISFDPGARTVQVHPGLKEALELVETGET
jgi:hypothetical protein